MGILIGDGWWDKKDYGRNKTRSIYLADSVGYNADVLFQFFSKYFTKLNYYKKEQLKTETNGRYGNTVKHIFSFEESTEFSQWLTFNFGGVADRLTTGAANKYIATSLIEETNNDFRKGLINGLMSTDGTISVNTEKHHVNIAYSSTSLQLIKNIEQILGILGIRHNSALDKITTKGNNAYSLIISSVDSKNYKLFDNIAHKDKRQNFNNIILTENSREHDNIYIPSFIIEQLLTSLTYIKYLESYITAKKVDTLRQTLCKARKTKLISRNKALEILAYPEEQNKFKLEHIKELKIKLSNLIQQESISTVEPIKCKVYELLNLLASKDTDKIKRQFITLFKRYDSLTPVLRNKIKDILNLTPVLDDNLAQNDQIKYWRSNIVENYNISWTRYDA